MWSLWIYYVCMYDFMIADIFTYFTHTNTHTHTHTDTDTDTHRHRHRRTHTHTHTLVHSRLHRLGIIVGIAYLEIDLGHTRPRWHSRCRLCRRASRRRRPRHDIGLLGLHLWTLGLGLHLQRRPGSALSLLSSKVNTCIRTPPLEV